MSACIKKKIRDSAELVFTYFPMLSPMSHSVYEHAMQHPSLSSHPQRKKGVNSVREEPVLRRHKEDERGRGVQTERAGLQTA